LNQKKTLGQSQNKQNFTMLSNEGNFPPQKSKNIFVEHQKFGKNLAK
jgi:hypothetical protein